MNCFPAALILALAAGSLVAQAPAPTPAVPPPMLPLATHYSYWPTQFVEFVGTELPYSMVVLQADTTNSKHPLLDLVLTDRATSKRVHYSDNDGVVAAATGAGDEAHKTAIAFEPADTEAVGSITNVRLTLADGKPLQFRFVQGSEISEQGSGLNPIPGAKIPIFAYRELGCVAGEGTALQIGYVVSTAAVWTEISHPPYFVAFHGAETQSAHTLVFSPAQEVWTVTSSPASLTAGATWELDEAHGNHRSIHIDKAEGAHLTVTSTDRFSPTVRTLLDVTRGGDGWSLSRARFSPARDADKHNLALAFATPLGATADKTAFTLSPGKKKPIASGDVTSSGPAADRTLALSFSNPAWLSAVSMTEQLTSTPTTLTLTAHP